MGAGDAFFGKSADHSWMHVTGVAMFESNEIIAYLEKTYAK